MEKLDSQKQLNLNFGFKVPQQITLPWVSGRPLASKNEHESRVVQNSGSAKHTSQKNIYG
jgi:hypothetical protein